MVKKVVFVTLKTLEAAQTFCSLNMRFPGFVDVLQDRYVVDGKSILGILSLSLLTDVEVHIQWDTGDLVDKLVDGYKDASIFVREDDSS